MMTPDEVDDVLRDAEERNAPEPTPRRAWVSAIAKHLDAPHLMVRYRCPRCDGESVLDAYAGPPGCLGGGTRKTHSITFMDGVEIVE